MTGIGLYRSLEKNQAYYLKMFNGMRLFGSECIQAEKTRSIARIYEKIEIVESLLQVIERRFGYKYDPNQPRVPAGNSNGGQWAYVGLDTGLPRVDEDAGSVQVTEQIADRLDKHFRSYNDGGMVNSSRARQVNIFIGGADDSGHIIGNGPVSKSSSLKRSIGANYYYAHDEEDEVSAKVANLPEDIQINLIGHSWGGDTAAKIAMRHDGERRINTLVTIDPVTTLGERPDFNKVSRGVSIWVNVNAVRRAGSTFLEPSNFVSGLGEWGNAPKGYAHIFISAPFNHADFNHMMNVAGTNDKTPQQIIDEGK